MMYNSVESSKTIGIVSHINPDGDALGSSIGLMGWLDSLGKSSRIFLPSGISKSLSFMVPPSIRKRIVVWSEDRHDEIQKAISECDLIFGVDFNTLNRIDRIGDIIRQSNARKILIDHHVGPEKEAFDLVYSKTDISSASELLYSILLQMPGIDGHASKLPAVTRKALLTGMTTDTNNFANSTYPSTLKMASEIIATGVDRDAIVQKLFFSYPKRRLVAQGYLLDKAIRYTGHGAAYMVLSAKDQNRLRLEDGDTEGFVNLPLAAREIKMSILAKEEKNSDRIRISIRSKKGTSARMLAMQFFNGGGHELASGGRLTKGKEVEGIEETGDYIEKCLNEFFSER